MPRPERTCPICGQDNRCKMDGELGNPCWCFTKKVPRGLLERIDREKRGKACVCSKCIDRYNEENKVMKWEK